MTAEVPRHNVPGWKKHIPAMVCVVWDITDINATSGSIERESKKQEVKS